MTQKSYATAEGMTMRIVSPDPISSPVDSLVVEFTNNRDADMTTGEWYRIDTKSEGGIDSGSLLRKVSRLSVK